MDDQERKVKSWRDFYEQVVFILYNLDSVQFLKLLNDKDLKKTIAQMKNKLRIPIKIADEIFIEVNLSSESILTNMRMITKKMGLDLNDISFYIK
jgi:hypothetical protein